MPDGAPSSGTLSHLLERTARAEPDRVLVAEADGARRSITASRLIERAGRVAGGLRSIGVDRDHPVVVWLPNGVEWLETLAAAARIGAAVIGVNTRFRSDELHHVTQRAGARALVVADDFLGIDFAGIAGRAQLGPGVSVVVVDRPGPAWRDTGLPTVAWEDLREADPVPGVGPGPADLLVGFTTSGTTGHPKLAVHDNLGVVRHAMADAAAFDVRPGDQFLLGLPLCGAFGFNTLLTALAGGATTLVQRRFDSEGAARAIASGGITHCNAGDDMLLQVLEQRAFPAGAHGWREGAFANFTNSAERVTERAESQAGVRLTGVYGASEVFALLSRWPAGYPVAQRSRSGGIPVDPGIEVRVVDPETRAPLPEGKEGELCFRGYPVLARYLGDPAATAAALDEEGWYHSGDLGRLCVDGPGFEYLARLGDSLRLRGFLVDPAEIERRLERHPAVEIAQVVGVDRPGTGEVAVAFVRVRDAVTEEELRRFCAAGIADLKVPERVVVVDGFPTVEGPNGTKILKRELRARGERLVSEARA